MRTRVLGAVACLISIAAERSSFADEVIAAKHASTDFLDGVAVDDGWLLLSFGSAARYDTDGSHRWVERPCDGGLARAIDERGRILWRCDNMLFLDDKSLGIPAEYAHLSRDGRHVVARLPRADDEQLYRLSKRAVHGPRTIREAPGSTRNQGISRYASGRRFVVDTGWFGSVYALDLTTGVRRMFAPDRRSTPERKSLPIVDERSGRVFVLDPDYERDVKVIRRTTRIISFDLVSGKEIATRRYDAGVHLLCHHNGLLWISEHRALVGLDPKSFAEKRRVEMPAAAVFAVPGARRWLLVFEKGIARVWDGRSRLVGVPGSLPITQLEASPWGTFAGGAGGWMKVDDEPTIVPHRVVGHARRTTTGLELFGVSKTLLSSKLPRGRLLDANGRRAVFHTAEGIEWVALDGTRGVVPHDRRLLNRAYLLSERMVLSNGRELFTEDGTPLFWADLEGGAVLDVAETDEGTIILAIKTMGGALMTGTIAALQPHMRMGPSRTLRRRWSGPGVRVNSGAALSLDGAFAAALSLAKGGGFKVSIVDVRRQRLRRVHHLKNQGRPTVGFSKDGHDVFVGFDSGSLHRFRVRRR